MSSRACLVIAAELENLPQVRCFVQETAQSWSVAPKALFDLRLAVDEAVTNVVVHGYHGLPGEVEITLEQGGNAVIVHIRDEAPPFDPTTVPLPDLSLPLDQQAPGGRGVYLIRKTVDQVMWHLTPTGGNELVLVKRMA